MFLMIMILLLPVAAAILMPLMKNSDRKTKFTVAIVLQAIDTLLCLILAIGGDQAGAAIAISSKVSIGLAADPLARFFCLLVSGGWLMVLLYSVIYLHHEENEERFLLFMFFSETTLLGVSLASGLVSMYLFFEMLTLLSMPLVLHELTEESIRAAMKYLFYSVGGAFLALFGIFVYASHAESLDFAVGGVLTSVSPVVLVATLCAVIGFGAKAGMFPLHGWLPTAHPVAPAPASALLSGLIAKAGVIAIIRVVFYIVGPAALIGTWVQTTLIILSLVTVFMGSMMAYTENVFKKRLAFSTVSQISYVLVGLFMLTEAGVQGAMLQVLFHAIVKIVLFLTAGMCICLYGKHRVEELFGFGKLMPVTFGCFIVASLSLIGIPPTGGFVSKWYLASAALSNSGIGALSWIAPVVLLISALLTAGYLLPVGIRAFFPGADAPALPEKKKEPILMLIPLIVFTAVALLGGIFTTPVMNMVAKLAASLF